MQWRDIKERNAPKQPPAKPDAVPFFLAVYDREEEGGYREKRETCHQHAGYSTRPEGDRKSFSHAAARRFGRTHIGAN